MPHLFLLHQRKHSFTSPDIQFREDIVQQNQRTSLPSLPDRPRLHEPERERSGAATVQASHIGEAALEVAMRGPVLIDDADSQPLDEQGLFHLINAVRGAGTHLMMTARRFPASWPVALADLQSRLKAAALVEIGEPDDALLAAIMAKLFADRQVEVEPHVIDFIVRRIERSLATAIAVVGRLDRLALERKSRISRALASEVVSELDAGQGALNL